MKSIKVLLMLFVSFMMASCGVGGDNLESYKTQYLDALAKEMGTTKDFLMKDWDISIDSMKIIPITVADSLALLEEVSADNGASLNKVKTEMAEMRKMEGLLSLFGGSNKEVEKAKAILEEMSLEISNLERALKNDLSKYKGMEVAQILAKVLSFQFVALDKETGIHKIEKRNAVFTPSGELVRTKCPITLSFYLKDKEEKRSENQ